MSNLSFLAVAEQIICRTPPLAASDYIANTKSKMDSTQETPVFFHYL